MDNIYTAQDVAKILGINIKTAYKKMKRADFPRLPRRKNEQYLVTKEAFEKWLNREEYSGGDCNEK